MRLPINNYMPISLDATAFAIMYKAYYHKTKLIIIKH